MSNTRTLPFVDRIACQKEPNGRQFGLNHLHSHWVTGAPNGMWVAIKWDVLSKEGWAGSNTASIHSDACLI